MGWNPVSITVHPFTFHQVEAVIFDKDGTLALSRPFLTHLTHLRINALEMEVPGHRQSLEHIFGLQHTSLRLDGLMAVGTRRENEIAAAAILSASGLAWGQAFALAQQSFLAADQAISRKASLTPPFPGVLSMFQRLQILGVAMGVLSSDTPDEVEDFLDCYAFKPWIHSWRGTQAQDPAKPDPRLFWEICEELSVVPSRCLIIGDSVVDQQLAANGGATGFVAVAMETPYDWANVHPLLTNWDDFAKLPYLAG